MTESQRKAYAHGIIAHVNSLIKKDNPYKFTNELYDFWNLGFNESPAVKNKTRGNQDGTKKHN